MRKYTHYTAQNFHMPSRIRLRQGTLGMPWNLQTKDHVTHLIYGEAELSRVQRLFPNLPSPKRDDPLTELFRDKGALRHRIRNCYSCKIKH